MRCLATTNFCLSRQAVDRRCGRERIKLRAVASPAPRLQVAVHDFELGVQIVQRLSHIQRHLAPPAGMFIVWGGGQKTQHPATPHAGRLRRMRAGRISPPCPGQLLA